MATDGYPSEKLRRLEGRLKKLGTVTVALSGGCDSVFLAKAARDTLGADSFAVTAHSPFFPAEEAERAGKAAQTIGIPCETVHVDLLADPCIRRNGPDRCYHCKRALFGAMLQFVCEHDLGALCDGTNADDALDYRPGLRALHELGILSPLQEVGMTKRDIRFLSRERGLSTWDLPASACLASRLPFGTEIDVAELKRVESAEEALRQRRFRGLWVRAHCGIARIELDPCDLQSCLDRRLQVIGVLKDCGFRYVTLDLEGYRMGSLNPAMGVPPS